MKSFNKRPDIGHPFTHGGIKYRVSAIYEHGVIGTRSSVEGTPLDHNDMIRIPLDQRGES